MCELAMHYLKYRNQFQSKYDLAKNNLGIITLTSF